MQSSHHQGFGDQFSGPGPVTLDPPPRFGGAGPTAGSGEAFRSLFPGVVPAGMDQMRPGGLF